MELQVRHPGERFVTRAEQEWPLARTQWTRLHLEPASRSLSREPVAGEPVAYETGGAGVTFLAPVATETMEITGSVAAKLWLSSDTRDADVFLVLRLFAPEEREVTFIGSNDPRVPVGLGWLRASHRKLDPDRSRPWQPFHPHYEIQPLEPGIPVELSVEIWPTSIVVPPGHRLALSLRGRDYENEGSPPQIPGAMYAMRGVGPFIHTDPRDRPPAVFGGHNTLHFEPGREPYLLLPVIPTATLSG